jgi:predicted small metal-binding protein
MDTQLDCPCGVHLEGEDEDDLVAKAQAHLAEAHPGHEYSREEILLMAY